MDIKTIANHGVSTRSVALDINTPARLINPPTIKMAPVTNHAPPTIAVTASSIDCSESFTLQNLTLLENGKNLTFSTDKLAA